MVREFHSFEKYCISGDHQRIISLQIRPAKYDHKLKLVSLQSIQDKQTKVSLFPKKTTSHYLLVSEDRLTPYSLTHLIVSIMLFLSLKRFNSRPLINNYWMRLSMISRIIQTEVNVICRSRRLRRITLTENGQNENSS